MLTKKPTSEMVEEWKKIFETYHCSLTPNRKTGSEVDSYFRNKYSYHIYDNVEFKKIVEFNIIANEHSRSKLQNDTKPNIKSYIVDEVFIGIDLISGEFYVESEDMNKCITINDDLFVFRGLDEEDLKNYFLVAEYVKLIQKKFQFIGQL